jgi:hypothetical protein
VKVHGVCLTYDAGGIRNQWRFIIPRKNEGTWLDGTDRTDKSYTTYDKSDETSSDKPALAPDVALTSHNILVRGEFFQRHRTASVQTIGANANLGAESKFAAVIKAGGGIPKYC